MINVWVSKLCISSLTWICCDCAPYWWKGVIFPIFFHYYTSSQYWPNKHHCHSVLTNNRPNKTCSAVFTEHYWSILWMYAVISGGCILHASCILAWYPRKIKIISVNDKNVKPRLCDASAACCTNKHPLTSSPNYLSTESNVLTRIEVVCREFVLHSTSSSWSC